MGHAIPALLFTKNDVHVFVGTYGDIKNCLRLSLGRLKLFLKINLLDWKLGMCAHSSAPALWQSFIIVLMGPIASLIISIPLINYIQHNDLSDAKMTLIMIFIVAACIDLMVNIVPSSSPIQMYDGKTSFNDGYQLFILFNQLREGKRYREIKKLKDDQDYEALVTQGIHIIENEVATRGIYTLVADGLIQLENYSDAVRCYQKLSEAFSLQIVDYKVLAGLYLKLGEFKEAHKLLDHYLYINFQDVDALVDRGICKLNQSEYIKAIEDFETAFSYNSEADQAFIYRAAALIKLEKYDLAYKDLKRVESKQQEDPWLFFYLAKYYEYKGEWQEALNHYKKAKALDVSHHGIDYLIAVLSSKIELS